MMECECGVLECGVLSLECWVPIFVLNSCNSCLCLLPVAI